LVSEYAPSIKPQTYFFIARNRIIAGLSKGVLITEAGEKSGSLKTADFAVMFNREIFVVPGRINSEMSRGTNKLIKNLQGCAVLEPEDILSSFNILKVDNSEKEVLQLDFNAQLVLNYIASEKKTYQEIVEYTKMPVKELNSMLMELEMEGLITKLSGNSYIKS
jgi:DNA processing protein